MAVQTQIQVRRDTAANWTSTNPTLAAGELGFETDTNKVKVGTGSTAWTTLSYINPTDVSHGMESQTYYGPNTDAALTSITVVEDQTYYLPFMVSTNTTFDRILLMTSGTFSGTASVRLGIYNNVNGLPTTVNLDAGTVSCTVANTNYTITINHSLSAGWYWLAFNMQTAATTSSFGAMTPLFPENTRINLSRNFQKIRFQTGVIGAFATAGTLNTGDSQSSPVVFLRKT